MSYEILLLASQAAGIGANLYGERQARRMASYGNDIEQGQLQLRMKEEQLATMEQTNFSLEQLRETLATQRAIQGARGALAGTGSAAAITNKSLAAHGADERARKLSSMFRQSQAEGLSRLLNIKNATVKSASYGKLLDYGLNSLSLNTTIGEYIEKGKTKQLPTGKSSGNWRSPGFLTQTVGR